MSKIHHITFSTGVNRVTRRPYAETQKLLVESIQSQTKRQVVHHTHDLESMKQQPWFHKIEHFPSIQLEKNELGWVRDGYFCAYKALFANALLDTIDEGDYIYYTDSSAYFREPFTENLDRFFDYVDYNGHVCGARGNDFAHCDFGCLTNEDVWRLVWPESRHYLPKLLNHKHLLASWYCFKNTEENRKFIREWAHLVTDVYIGNRPIVTLHHTVDQSLFNILVYKYGLRTFFNNTNHDHNKNHNNVHRFINACTINHISELDVHFPRPIDYCK
jgi:hypothetical protein